MNSPQRYSVRLRSRAGQSLVEFALVALVLYMLLAAMLTFGHMLYVAQGLQGAADLAAREISRTPFHAIDPDTLEPLTFEQLFVENVGVPTDLTDNDLLRSRIFDPAYLVLDLAAFYAEKPEGNVFVDVAPQLPLLNQQLLTLMIVDRPDFDGDGEADAWYLRYPGALLSRTALTPPAGKAYESYVVDDRTVAIPLITNGTIRWVSVVEEIDTEESNDNAGLNPDPFSIQSTQNGIVALRINYPFQSASMSAFRPTDVPFDPTIGNPIFTSVTPVAPTTADGTPIDIPNVTSDSDPTYAGTYGGTYGLGAQGAFGQVVRPYRRVISAQAIYRREVFE